MENVGKAHESPAEHEVRPEDELAVYEKLLRLHTSYMLDALGGYADEAAYRSAALASGMSPEEIDLEVDAAAQQADFDLWSHIGGRVDELSEMVREANDGPVWPAKDAERPGHIGKDSDSFFVGMDSGKPIQTIEFGPGSPFGTADLDSLPREGE